MDAGPSKSCLSEARPDSVLTCSTCGSQIRPGMRKCRECGAILVVTNSSPDNPGSASPAVSGSAGSRPANSMSGLVEKSVLEDVLSQAPEPAAGVESAGGALSIDAMLANAAVADGAAADAPGAAAPAAGQAVANATRRSPADQAVARYNGNGAAARRVLNASGSNRTVGGNSVNAETVADRPAASGGSEPDRPIATKTNPQDSKLAAVKSKKPAVRAPSAVPPDPKSPRKGKPGPAQRSVPEPAAPVLPVAGPESKSDAAPSVVRKQMSFLQKRKLRKTLATTGENAPRPAELRRAALEELGAGTDLSVVPDVIAALSDAWIIVRRAAAQALGRIGDPSAVGPLIKLLATEIDPGVRRAIGQSLKLLDDEKAIAPLIVAAAGPPRDRGWAFEALAGFGTRARSPLATHLRHSDFKIRAAAAEAAGRIGDPSLVKPLLPLIGDAEGAVRQAAAIALGEIGAPQAAGPILVLLDDPDEPVRIHAAEALSKLHEPSGVPRLIGALHDECTEVRVHAATALGLQGDQAAIGPLASLMGDEHDTVRRAAISALMLLGGELSVVALCGALQDPVHTVRLRAAEGLGILGTPLAVEHLIGALDDRHSVVRREACEGLARLADPAMLQPFYRKLRTEPSVDVRLSIVRALGQMGNPESIEPLKEALNDEFAVRSRVCVALGQIGTDEATEALIPLLDDPVPEIRHHAASALGAIGDRRVITHLEKLIDDPDLLVRRGVGKALQQLGDPRGERLLDDVYKAAANAKTQVADRPHARNNRPGLSFGKATAAFISESVQGIRDRFSMDDLRERFSGSGEGPDNRNLIIGIPVLLLALGLGGLYWWWSSARYTPVAWHPVVQSFAPLGGQGIVAAVTSTKAGVGAAAKSRSSLVVVPSAGGEAKPTTREIDVEEGAVQAVAANPAGDLVAVANPQGKIFIYSIESGKVQHTLESHTEPIKVLRFLKDGKTLVSADTAGSLKTWDVDAGTQKNNLQPYTDGFRCIHVSPDGTKAAFGLSTGVINIWDLQKNEQFASIPGHAGPVTCLAFSGDGHFLATAGSDSLWVCWDLVERKRKCEGAGSNTSSMSFSENGKLLAVGTAENNEIKVWDVEVPEGQEPRTLQIADEAVALVGFSGDSRLLVVVGTNITDMFVLDPLTGKPHPSIALK